VQEKQFSRFLANQDKRFKGYDQFLVGPEKKVTHKNKRLIRLDDVDMGEEVEAAIFNSGGKPASESLKQFINSQMNKIMDVKMNEENYTLKPEDFDPKRRRKRKGVSEDAKNGQKGSARKAPRRETSSSTSLLRKQLQDAGIESK